MNTNPKEVKTNPQVTYKKMLQQLVSGGSAGLVEICLMHPLDVVKTRFQLQGGSKTSIQYRSVAHCFSTMYKTEGFLSFYKGILPPILAETPKRAVKFFCFERYKEALSFGGPKTWQVYAAAGLCSGLTEGLIINPFERVKVQLQSEKNVALKDQESTFRKASRIIKEGGIGTNGLNRGLTATLGRHGVWNMVYFGIYHEGMKYAPEPENKTKYTMYRLLFGFTAGTLASIANIPYDVAKSRIQGPQTPDSNGRLKYRGAHSTMMIIFKEEGFLALYKGLLPKLMRLGPSGAIMMYVYQTLSDFLAKKFP